MKETGELNQIIADISHICLENRKEEPLFKAGLFSIKRTNMRWVNKDEAGGSLSYRNQRDQGPA